MIKLAIIIGAWQSLGRPCVPLGCAPERSQGFGFAGGSADLLLHARWAHFGALGLRGGGSEEVSGGHHLEAGDCLAVLLPRGSGTWRPRPWHMKRSWGSCTSSLWARIGFA